MERTLSKKYHGGNKYITNENYYQIDSNKNIIISTMSIKTSINICVVCYWNYENSKLILVEF